MEGDAAIVERARLSLVHLKELNLYLVNSPSVIHANRFFPFTILPLGSLSTHTKNNPPRFPSQNFVSRLTEQLRIFLT